MKIKVLILLSLLSIGCGGDLANDKFYQMFKVEDTIACWEDDVYEVICKVKARDSNNSVRFFKVGGDYPIAGVDHVYRECWEDGDEVSCFAITKTRPVRESYKAGGRRYD